MQEELKIALVQSNLVWENPDQNRKIFSEKINAISESIDLLVLPEMFSTGFTMNPQNVFETMTGETVLWMQKIAMDKSIAIAGSLVIKEENNYYNRLFFVYPDGMLKTYDKRHTFTLVGEDKVYTAGTQKLILEYKGWKICPLICYDLRFPVWARNTEDYDLLIYVANWPEKRISAWDTLLKARAIENMSYTIGVNRIGLDDNQYQYPGHSACYDVLGKKLTSISPDEEKIEIVSIQKQSLLKLRQKLQFLNDRDSFTVHQENH